MPTPMPMPMPMSKFMMVTMLSMVVYMLCFGSATVDAGQGNAVYYDPPYSRSACYGISNRGAMVTGVSEALWGNGAACGQRYRVRCIGGANTAPHPCKSGSVDVTVIDFCRSPCNGILNLSRDAFARIADTDAGKVRVQFDRI